jgi:SRSO17 transposase
MDLENQFAEYIGMLALSLRHADRVAPLADYCRGLILPGDRKSVEPMAAVVAPREVSAKHQSLHHFVAQADWSDERLLAQVRAYVVPRLEARGAIEAWIVDDTGYPKKGEHSVGVARQYCGQLGKQENCQVAVSVSVANEAGSLPIAYRLYLPREWAEDGRGRAKVAVPAEVSFATKPAIALGQLRVAKEAGVPAGVVLADAAYGTETAFREGVNALGLVYAVGIQSTTTLWAPGTGPLPPKAASASGRKPRLLRRDAKHQPLSAKALAHRLPASAYRAVAWREGNKGLLRSRFARVRVRAAHRDYWRAAARPEEWLLIEWPTGEAEPSKYWLSSLPETIAMRELVRIAKLRWRIERDFQELKQELGLGHYEGRNWRGFHHHASLCIAAYGFLMACRLGRRRGSKKNTAALLQFPRRPNAWRPRGAAAAA